MRLWYPPPHTTFSVWGDRVTRPGCSRGGHHTVGTEGASGQRGDMRGHWAAEAFPEVPRRGLRTIRQQAAGVGCLDIRRLPAGSCWPKRRGPEPATSPASGVTYKHRASATLSGRASPARPAPRPHCALSGCLAQVGWETGKNRQGGGGGAGTGEASPGTNADRAWGWEGPSHPPWGWEGSQQGREEKSIAGAPDKTNLSPGRSALPGRVLTPAARGGVCPDSPEARLRLLRLTQTEGQRTAEAP